MTDKTHQLIGLTLATVGVTVFHASQSFTWPVVGAVVIGSTVGSIIPDIDQPTARIWRTIPLGGRTIGRIASFSLGGHRHLSHSLVGGGLFYLLLLTIIRAVPHWGWFDPTILIQSAMIGFAGHLAADAVTVEGIPLFWPYPSYLGFPPVPFQGARIVTGKWFENLIIFPAVSLLLVAFVLAQASRFCPILPFLCGR